MNQISPSELQEWQAADEELLLVDVREPFEHEHYNIGGQLIPLGELMAHALELPREKRIVVYCEKGVRSMIAIQRLQQLGFDNLYNLTGGMKAWRSSL